MSVTGRRWQRPQRECPYWCAKDHRCTAQHGYVSGEHRSDPLTWQLPYGRLVASRVATTPPAPRDRLEVRATVWLPGDEQTASEQAYRLVASIDRAIRAVLRLPAGVGLLRELARQQFRREARR